MKKVCIFALLMTFVAHFAQAADAPEVIRIGAPALQGDTQMIWGATGIARLQGGFEEEFAKEGIKFEFPGFKGGGPMVTQALVNKQIDFAGNGDMISIIARSSGAKTRLILPSNRLTNAYLLVKPDSPLSTIKELAGKKVAYFKGNYIQLQVIRILKTEGMTEKDIRNVSLRGASAINALISGKVDAVFCGSEGLESVNKGLTKIAYSTLDQSPLLTAQSGVLVRDDFAKQYPDITARVVKVLVKAAHWASDPANKDQVIALWSRGGVSLAALQKEYSVRPIADRINPSFDPFLYAQYADTQNQLQELGMLRGDKVNIDEWFDPSYQQKALKDLHLEHYWKPLDAKGNESQ